MRRFYRYVIAVVATIMLSSALVPPIAYANETSYQLQQQAKFLDSNNLFNSKVSEHSITAIIAKNKEKYPTLSEERMLEIAHLMTSPYQTRASVWDGEGITLDEFAWAFDVAVSATLGGYGLLGNYIAKHGVGVARQLLSRTAMSVARRFGFATAKFAGFLSGIWRWINIYHNVGYAIAQLWDGKDSVPNNGRINL